MGKQSSSDVDVKMSPSKDTKDDPTPENESPKEWPSWYGPKENKKH